MLSSNHQVFVGLRSLEKKEDEQQVELVESFNVKLSVVCCMGIQFFSCLVCVFIYTYSLHHADIYVFMLSLLYLKDCGMMMVYI